MEFVQHHGPSGESFLVFRQNAFGTTVSGRLVLYILLKILESSHVIHGLPVVVVFLMPVYSLPSSVNLHSSGSTE